MPAGCCGITTWQMTYHCMTIACLWRFEKRTVSEPSQSPIVTQTGNGEAAVAVVLCVVPQTRPSSTYGLLLVPQPASNGNDPFSDVRFG